MNHNLYARFEARFPAAADAPCLSLPDGRTIGYAELKAQSARYAHLLRSLGAQPGDRVAAQVEKSPAAVFLYLGALRAGCVFLPINPAYQRGELTHLLGDARPHVYAVRTPDAAQGSAVAALTGVAHTLTLDDDGNGGTLAEAAAAQPEHFDTVQRSADDLAAILYTSGTTGRAKGAMLSHHNLFTGVQTLHAQWRFQPGDVLLHILPIFHFHGLFVALHCALWNGSQVLFEPRFDARRAVQLLSSATVCMGVPTNYVRMLAEPGLDKAACARVRLFISGSAPLLPDTFERFFERTGHTILERYGMTEGGMFASNPYDGERRCGTVGPALPGVSLRVVDDQCQPVAPDAVGQIQVQGENVFVGYWNLPEKTRAEHTDDGFFRTGDLGRLSADGYLTIVGRDKDLIISGGLNVYPKEIEEVLDGVPGVKESAVIGIRHPDFGEAVTAVVVPDASAPHTADADALVQAVRAQLASFKVPKHVHFVDELPRNAMGKVQKNLLRERFA
ncbi:AMP-binding protein [Hydrogenophaga sp.]|uniref:AMP-binding protein n=1 Tax=Hydrogenophaga sp. TaxID=1904254 RepID=UPI002728601F|nr:AMP-binding protein [Hydrogenophaga sp.]MDO9439077.1 AMP-binding protein [Hydrogenophaga sp.]